MTPRLWVFWLLLLPVGAWGQAIEPLKPVLISRTHIELFRTWLKSEVRYPKPCLDQGIEGRVVFCFIVSPTGEVMCTEILQGVAPEIDNEVLRALLASPRWVPPRNKQGTPIWLHYKMSLDFSVATHQSNASGTASSVILFSLLVLMILGTSGVAIRWAYPRFLGLKKQND